MSRGHPHRKRILIDGDSDKLALLLFYCAKTVSELDLFEPLGLPFERKQIPRIVVNVRIQRKTTELLEATSLPWAQGVVCSNHTAPTNQ